MSLPTNAIQPNESAAQPLARAMVINGHGTQSNKTFNLSGNTLITPESLYVPYFFTVKSTHALERSFREGLLYPVSSSRALFSPEERGQWQKYTANTSIPQVQLKPWNEDESQTLAQRLLNDTKLWSDLDGKNGLLFKRDPRASLVIKHEGNLYILKGEALAKYCDKLQNKSLVKGKPLAFISPALGKIKVLNPTTLSEILEAYKSEYGNNTFMLATCNEDGIDSRIVNLEVDKAPSPIDTIFAPSKGLTYAWNSIKLQPQGQASNDEANLNKKNYSFKF